MMVKKQKEIKRLYRSRQERILGGVCGGFSEYLVIDITMLRVLWILTLFYHGIGALAYFAFLLLTPINPKINVKVKHRTASENIALVSGIAFLCLGLFIFARFYWQPFFFLSWPLWEIWPLQKEAFVPILLILFGIVLLIRSFNKKSSPDSNRKTTNQRSRNQKLFRSRQNKMINGVCGGLAEYWKIEVTFIRVGYLLFTVLTHPGVGLVIYFLLALIVPQEQIKVKGTSTD